MRRSLAVRGFFIALLSILYISTAQAQLTGLKPEITGSWFNPAQDGHGFNFQVLDENTLLVFWYTYQPDGTSTFLVGTVTSSGPGTYTGMLQQTNGMMFGSFRPADNSRFNWGMITITILDCNSATVSWSPVVAGYSNGSIPIQRLSSTNLGTCTDDAVVGNYMISYADENDRYAGTALFLPDGEMYFATGIIELSTVGAGTWRRFGQLNMPIDGVTYEIDGSGSPPLTSDVFSTNATLNINGFGDLAASTVATPRLTGVRLADYRRNVSVAALAGTYDLIDTAISYGAATITIDANGDISGTAINGCNLEGEIVQTLPMTNQFSISILFTDSTTLCSDSDLVGAGYRIDPGDVINPNDIFAILVNPDKDYASVFRLNR